MADWADSIELTRGHKVWVRHDHIIETVPSLDLVFDDTPPVRSRNRDGATTPPALRRQRQRATPVPLYASPLLNEGPEIDEKTPPTFDMGLSSGTLMEDEPTEWEEEDPQFVVEALRASLQLEGVEDFESNGLDQGHLDLQDYDDEEDCPSTEIVPRNLVPGGGAASGGTDWYVTKAPPQDEQTHDDPLMLDDPLTLEDPLTLDDISLLDIDSRDEDSLTLDLQTDWLVPIDPGMTFAPQAAPVRAPQARAALVRAPPMSLASRAPAPVAIQPLRSSVPRTAQAPTNTRSVSSTVVNTVTFASGIVVGSAAGMTLAFLSITASLLV